MSLPAILSLALLAVYYITIVIDLGWWSLVQKNEISSIEFDYIVIGGGTGGCTAAGRLSENGKYNVLLLEAGPSSSPLNRIPLIGRYSTRSKFAWSYETEPQERSFYAMEGQRAYQPYGKILGGSSQLNYMLYMRGQPRDFDRWGELNPGWSYKDVRPFFEKSITYIGAKNVIGKGGPWQIVRGRGINELDDKFVRSGEKLGYKQVDPSSEEGPGLYYVDTNTPKGLRHSPVDAFLIDRPNLHIVTNAMVNKIDIVDGQAKAVIFDKFSETMAVSAKREIILAAGAINTPTVLLRSGVGPQTHLNAMGIEQVVDLPVGENLESHVGTILTYITNTPTNVLASNTLSSLKQYITSGTGFMVANTCNSGLLHSTSLSESADWPDVQLSVCNFHAWEHGRGAHNSLNFKRELYDEALLELNETTHGMTMLACLLRPQSRGYVRLASKDPSKHPIIQPNFLKQDSDVRKIVEGMRVMETLAATSPLKDIIIRKVTLGPCKDLTGDAQLECQLRHITGLFYHPTSTCRMAPRDQGGVVDAQLKVYGVEGLRIMDASVMPHTTSGNTNAPVVMIAEKGADMVLRGLSSPDIGV